MANKKPGSAGPQASKTESVCRKLAEPIAQQLQVNLWDVRFEKEGSTWFLRYILDKDEGLSIDDCVAFSRLINPILDEADPIPQSYCLEVTSPGVERELTRPEHFAYCEGWPVMVQRIRPLDGRREFTGLLKGLDQDGNVVLELEDGSLASFPKKEIAKVRTIDDFDYEAADQDDDVPLN